MVITEVTTGEVLSSCRQALGLPDEPDRPIDDELIAALLRRSAGYLCPCSRVTLRAALLESLDRLENSPDPLPERIDGAIEGLIVGGDLLELNDVATADPDVRGTWVFAAPPSFIERPSGSIFLIGLVPDQDSFLPQSLSSRIEQDGLVRFIQPRAGEDLLHELKAQGIQELSEAVWLKAPKSESATGMLNRMDALLASQAPSGAIEGLQIVDPTKPVTYYRGRWISPAKQHSGTFVARRPQEFGAPLWCFVKLEAGIPVKFVDLPIMASRWRGCDVAWHLQMAIDACRSAPQHYRSGPAGGGTRFDFFSPLPQWAQRRLMILGKKLQPERALISYLLPIQEATEEEKFLRERLWLARSADPE